MRRAAQHAFPSGGPRSMPSPMRGRWIREAQSRTKTDEVEKLHYPPNCNYQSLFHLISHRIAPRSAMPASPHRGSHATAWFAPSGSFRLQQRRLYPKSCPKCGRVLIFRAKGPKRRSFFIKHLDFVFFHVKIIGERGRAAYCPCAKGGEPQTITNPGGNNNGF